MSSFKRFQVLPYHHYENRINIQEFLTQDFRANTPYIVSWYGRLTNKQNGSIRNGSIRVEVYFVNQKSEFYTRAVIPIELIPKMPIGSVWINGTCSSKLLASSDTLVMLRDVGYEGSVDTNIEYRNLHNEDFPESLKRHYHISKNKDNKGHSRFVFQDFNTILTVPASINGAEKLIIIHPLTFLQAHYGVSKSISNTLLGHLWADVCDRLHLDYRNPSCSELVFIPDELLVADSVFLYHLKNDHHTQNVVRKLNARVRDNFTSNLKKHGYSYSYLKVEPYHSQPVHLLCNYIAIDDKTLLCTEITGISMPQGETVFYDVDIVKRTASGECNRPKSNTVKILMHDIANNEIMLKDETADNRNVAVVRQGIQTVGDTRAIARNQNISLEEQLRANTTTVVMEPPPEGYTDGHRIGAGGNTGLLQVTLVDSEKDEFGITGFDSQYQRLLKYAQHLKQNANSHGYHEVKIDCCDKLGEKQGEIVKPIVLNQSSFPRSVYILRLQIDSSIYYFLDCESRDKQSSSGVVVKVLDEERFLLDWDRGYTLKMLVNILKDNKGCLKQSVYEEVGVNGVKASNIVVGKYKHMNEKTSDWVLSGLGKFKGLR